SATYTYDGNGQRTSATVTAGGLTTTTTDYTYDGITLLSLSAARSDETTYAVAYLHDEEGRPYAGVYRSSEVTGSVTFLIATTDRGDVVALTDAEGAVFARYTYDPYGAVLSQETDAAGDITAELAEAIAPRQPLRYAGYVYDAHSATYYLSARHYDPATARFLTKDPARDDGEESAYQYCAGDPAGKVDASGMAAVRITVPATRLRFWKGLWGYQRLGERYFGNYLWIVWTRGTISRLCSGNPHLWELRRALAALYVTAGIVVSKGGVELVTGLVSLGVPNNARASDAIRTLSGRAQRMAATAQSWERRNGHMSNGRHRTNRVHLYWK
ncbi:MAG: RHS repeat-associated core domain-containing protein, partial [Coriobacteriia bacterium]|nr:RHS repeat-associated core domain-containing protein [Coriobacteriia bacterium]